MVMCGSAAAARLTSSRGVVERSPVPHENDAASATRHSSSKTEQRRDMARQRQMAQSARICVLKTLEGTCQVSL
eukprot:1288052-Prymnesium_polylepis.1